MILVICESVFVSAYVCVFVCVYVYVNEKPHTCDTAHVMFGIVSRLNWDWTVNKSGYKWKRAIPYVNGIGCNNQFPTTLLEWSHPSPVPPAIIISIIGELNNSLMNSIQ